MIEIRKTFSPDGMLRLDYLTGVAFSRESGAHRFIISGPEAFTGTVTASFMRADGQCVIVTGSLDEDGRAVVTADEDCYLVPGRMLITVYLTGEDSKVCIYAGLATVYDDRGSGEAPSGETTRTIEEMLEEILEGVDNAQQLLDDAGELLDDVTAEGATQVAAVQAKGDQVIASIPSDYSTLTGDVSSLKSAVNEITTEENISEQHTDYYTTPWTTGGGINANGTLVEVGTWAYTDKIPVQKGDVITCDALNGSLQRTSRPIRYLCAYNGDTPVPASGSSSEIQTYTVGDGVTHIVVTQASFTSYTGQRVIINSTETFSTLWLKQDKIGGFRQSGNLSSGNEFVFPITNAKQYKEFSFSATVSAFSSLVLGRYVDNVAKESVTIGTTKITVTNTYGAETDFDYPTEQSQPTDPPVFTVDQNVQVLIATGKRNRLTLIRVISNGVVFEVKENQLANITWNADKGYPFVKSVGSTLTDCFASWTTRKINAPIWIFGDSYLSYDTTRWPYYLIEDGYDVDCMFNAYAGENSANAVIAFDNLISSARPKIVVWALGMNDPDDPDSDSEDKVDANWSNAVGHIKSVCAQKGVELILCTIPTTEIMNNNYKNAWIRNDSNLRYIDFAAGVGAGTDGQWFTGLLDPDKVHPTAKGAKTLYYTFLSQFPEVLINN